MPPSNLVTNALAHRLLGDDSEGVTHVKASNITVRGLGESIRFSRDGELASHEELTLSVEQQAIGLGVAEGYDPDPD
jgi:diacylglycerol kinase family enzyme